MKLDGQPLTYQIMFEQNAGGTFVTRIESDEWCPSTRRNACGVAYRGIGAQRLRNEGRVRLQGFP